MSIYTLFTERDKGYLEQLMALHLQRYSETIGVPMTLSSELVDNNQVNITVQLKIGGGNAISVTNDIDNERQEYERLCSKYGFAKSEYGAVIKTSNGASYKFIGFNPRNPKNVCKLIKLSNNTECKANSTLVRNLLDKA